METNPQSHLRIDYFLDVICPWCWIGLRHLRAAESGITRANARALVDEWITLQGSFHPIAWQPDIMARRIIAGTEDVGSRFAAEARRMHYGEVEERGIRGQASVQETAELLDEGIAVLPLLLPEAAKEPLQ